MKKILLYGLEEEKTKITEKVAREFGIEINKIAKDNLDKKVGELFNLDLRENDIVEDENKLMVFSDFDRNILQDFLIALKKEGVMVDHKCVLTETNAAWTFDFLMDHIRDEHRVVTKFRELGGLVKIALDRLEDDKDDELMDLVERAIENKNREMDEEKLDSAIKDLREKLNIK
ncbi:MAG: DUF3783 domain-containing protein [Peptoniphilus grossensis]|uniref:DUF3783 domain-containing protein n=1 Tax=Peptoniphilus grossensis TaxID=1465756 RepID=UPI00258584DE|nr:DUF3783 domain-containing protein [Peptoniphilus grossensis]MDU5099524.1 DUF3783 domain-containing protein [Peptoniphilus grossensis]